MAAVAALGAMAFGAGSAQAGVFKINGGAALLAEVVGSSEALVTLLVPGRNLTLICHSAKVLPGSHIISGTEGLGKIRFESCLPFSHTKGTALPCTVHDPEVIAILLPKLHNNEPYVVMHPDGPLFGGVKTFTTKIMLGESCPLPEVNPVIGSLSAKVTTNNKAVNLMQFSPATATLLGTSIKFGGAAATIEASATLELTGAHAGLAFGVA